MEKFRTLLNFNKLLVVKLLTTITLHMRNFIANFVRILRMDFAANRVNELGDIPQCGMVPKFSGLKVVDLGVMADAFDINNKNLLFHCLHHECKGDFPNLISRRLFNARRKLTARFAEEIRKDVAIAIDRSEYVFCIDSKLVKVCQNARAKRGTMGQDDINVAPDWEYCASQGMYYYGYKLHVVCKMCGVIHSYNITAANVHDFHYLKDVCREYRDCMMLGGKEYLSNKVQNNLFEVANITLDAPYRLNQKTTNSPRGPTNDTQKTNRNCVLKT